MIVLAFLTVLNFFSAFGLQAVTERHSLLLLGIAFAMFWSDYARLSAVPALPASCV